MRMIYFVVLLVILLAIGVFAAENREMMTLRYFKQSVSSPRWAMIGIVYLAGLVSGCAVVGLVRRSLRSKP